jgi:hypothetical protein
MVSIVFFLEGERLFSKAYEGTPVPRVGEQVMYGESIYDVNSVLYHYHKSKIAINLVKHKSENYE